MSREHWDHDYADPRGDYDLDLGVQKQCDINQNEELKAKLGMSEKDEDYLDVDIRSESMSPVGNYEETCTVKVSTTGCTTDKSQAFGNLYLEKQKSDNGLIGMMNEVKATMSSTECLKVDKEVELAGKTPDTEVEIHCDSISAAGTYDIDTCTVEVSTTSCDRVKSPAFGDLHLEKQNSNKVQMGMMDKDEAAMSSTECLIELDKGEELSGKSPETEVDRFWDGRTSELVIGMKFLSRTEAKEFVKLYGAKQRCKMIVVSGGASEGCSSRKVIYYSEQGSARLSKNS